MLNEPKLEEFLLSVGAFLPFSPLSHQRHFETLLEINFIYKKKQSLGGQLEASTVL